jgi:hypothetical protein
VNDADSLSASKFHFCIHRNLLSEQHAMTRGLLIPPLEHRRAILSWIKPVSAKRSNVNLLFSFSCGETR